MLLGNIHTWDRHQLRQWVSELPHSGVCWRAVADCLWLEHVDGACFLKLTTDDWTALRSVSLEAISVLSRYIGIYFDSKDWSEDTQEIGFFRHRVDLQPPMGQVKAFECRSTEDSSAFIYGQLVFLGNQVLPIMLRCYYQMIDPCNLQTVGSSDAAVDFIMKKRYIRRATSIVCFAWVPSPPSWLQVSSQRTSDSPLIWKQRVDVFGN